MRKIILLMLASVFSFMNLGIGFAADFPSPSVPDGLGVQIHLDSSPTKDLDLVKNAGFKFIRTDISWWGIEGVKGYYNWSKYDQLMDGLSQRGIRPILELDFNNPVYGGAWNTGIASQTTRDAFVRYAKTAAERYKGRGVIWEIWNEPNLSIFWKPYPNVNDYMALVKAVVPAIRSVDPSATIIAPAAAYYPSTDGFDFPFLEGCFKLGLLQYVDGVSLHPYRQAPPENVVSDVQKLRSLIAQYSPSKPNIPIISSEWGYATSWAATGNEQTQSNYLERMLIHNLSLGIPLSIWYDLRNDGTDSTNQEHNFGMLRYDGTPKPAYYAMQRLSQQLRGLHFDKRLASASSDYLLQFTNGTTTKVAAWTTGSSHNVTIDGKTVTIGRAPAYITVTSGTTPPPVTIPAAATGLTASVAKATTGNSIVTLRWTDASTNETGFKVMQSVGSTSNFQSIKTVAFNTTTTTADLGTNPTSGTYYYQIVAENTAGSAQPSNTASVQVSATPPPTSNVPAAPSNLTLVSVSKGATSGNYYVNLKWTDNSTNETGFQILQSINSTTSFKVVKTPKANGTSYGINLGSTPTQGTYYYKIVAVNDNGTSAPSNTVTAQIGTATPPPPTVTIPATPTGLTASITKAAAGNYVANLSWTDASTNETGFRVMQSVNSTTSFQQVQSLGANVGSTTIDLGTNPTQGTYNYQIIAINSAGSSQPSNTASDTLTISSTPTTPALPAAPSNLTLVSVTKGATTGNYYVNLKWTDNSTNETGFQILQSINSTTSFKVIKTPKANGTSYGINLGKKPVNGTYYYKIVAVNGNGTSAPSNTVTAQIGTVVTPPPAPTPPATATGLTATVAKATTGNYVVTLSWTDASNNETGFKVMQSVGSTSNFQSIKTVASNTTTTTADLGTNPTSGTYYYQIVAENTAGSAQPSNTASVQVTVPAVPAAPSNLTLVSVTKGATTGNYYVNLRWTDNSTNETGFQILQSINSTTSFKVVKTPAANGTSYGINLGSTPVKGTYYYKIVAVNGNGTSAPSNTITATIN